MLKIYIYWHKCWCNGCGTGQVKIVLLSFWSVNRWVSQWWYLVTGLYEGEADHLLCRIVFIVFESCWIKSRISFAFNNISARQLNFCSTKNHLSFLVLDDLFEEKWKDCIEDGQHLVRSGCPRVVSGHHCADRNTLLQFHKSKIASFAIFLCFEKNLDADCFCFTAVAKVKRCDRPFHPEFFSSIFNLSIFY